MVLNIDRDQTRFKQIVRGAIRKNLKKYLTRGDFIGKKGKDFVSIPVPQIEIPTIKYDPRDTGGVGQGEGPPGTPIGAEPGEGDGGAGDAPGQHVLEAEVQLTELAKILGEELELPNIKPRGKKNISAGGGPLHRNQSGGTRLVTTLQTNLSPGPQAPARFRKLFR